MSEFSREDKDRLRDNLKRELGREPIESEEVNMENDALLIAKYLLEQIIDLRTRVEKLEKNKSII